MKDLFIRVLLKFQRNSSTINYEWFGNVRELENAIELAVIFASSRQIELDDLPEAISKKAFEFYAQTRHERTKAASEGREILLEVDFPATIDEIEKQAIEMALDYTGGDKSRATKSLNIDRKMLYRKLEQYSLSDYSEVNLHKCLKCLILQNIPPSFSESFV